MIYLSDNLLIGWDISVLHREAIHAARSYRKQSSTPRYDVPGLPPPHAHDRWEAVARWFDAVAEAIRVERERRSGEGPQRFPVVIRWEPNPDAPRTDSDLELDLVLSSTTVVFNVERTKDARELRNVWHDLLVQLAELRDQRKREHHALSVGRLMYGPSSKEPEHA